MSKVTGEMVCFAYQNRKNQILRDQENAKDFSITIDNSQLRITTANNNGGVSQNLLFDESGVAAFLDVLRNLKKNGGSSREKYISLQKIFFGAPGTGKSYKVNEKAPENSPLTFRTTFHPDYDYAQFVGSYKPRKECDKSVLLTADELLEKLMDFKATGSYPVHKFSAKYFNSLKDLDAQEQKELLNKAQIPESMQTEILKGIAVGEFLSSEVSSSITYSFVPQVFAKAYVAAWCEYLVAEKSENADPVYLVIEEINRGNCAQIFGDIFQLLDRDDEGYSRYEIDADADFAEWLESQIPDQVRNDARYPGKGKLRLPPNFNILATMNTSDQSLFPMDSAFKRRFDWEYVPIAFKNDDGSEKSAAKFEVEVGNEKYRWQAFVENVNKKIEDLTESEDKQLGEYFIQPDKKAKDDDAEKTVISEDRFKGKVMFYLWNEVCKDEHKNGSFFKVDGKYFTFQELYKDPSKLSAFMKEMTKTTSSEQ